MKVINFFSKVIVLYVVLAGCTSAPKTQSTGANEKSSESITIPGEIELQIEGNDQMQFNKDKLEVIEGQKVTLKLAHTGKMSVESMGHNWVLLARGVDVDKFGSAAIGAKETGYIPVEMKDQVIAYTQTIGGGQETSITFDAPTRGYYTFICSFPGHYGVMQGSFVVSPK